VIIDFNDETLKSVNFVITSDDSLLHKIVFPPERSEGRMFRNFVWGLGLITFANVHLSQLSPPTVLKLED